jgi:hypothetical protein
MTRVLDRNISRRHFNPNENEANRSGCERELITPMPQSAQDRIDELEQLVSRLRHDVRGSLATVALLADRLMLSSDPAIQRSAARLTAVIERTISMLNGTNELVPPRGSQAGGPVLGAGEPPR